MRITMLSACDNFSNFGFDQFISAFGFSKDICRDHQNIQFEFIESNSQKEISFGWVRLENKELPVFTTPEDLSDRGVPLITYRTSDGDRSYPCAVESEREIIIGFDVFRQVGLILSGVVEREEYKQQIKGRIHYPFLDYYMQFIFFQVLKMHDALKIPFIHKSFWPNGRNFAVCLTHDVDEIKKTYQWITYPLKYARQRNFNQLRHQFRSFKYKLRGNEPFWTFESIITIEKEFGVKSTFFFLNEHSNVSIFNKKTWRHLGRRYNVKEERLSNLLKDLRDNGWEVGLHGSYDSFSNCQKILEEKEYLEEALGSELIGCRQHNLNLAIPETWICQENAGIEYDTTLGYNDRIGFRWGTCFPFQPYLVEEGRSLNILEIPLIIEDLPYFLRSGDFSADAICAEVKYQKGVLTLLWHPIVFNPDEFPGWGKRYQEIIQICQKENAWVVRGGDIYQWWISRKAMDFHWGYEDDSLTIEFTGDPNLAYFDLHLPKDMVIQSIENGEIINSQENLVQIKGNSNSNSIHVNF